MLRDILIIFYISRNIMGFDLIHLAGELRQARISRIEQAEGDPKISTLMQLSRALKLEIMLVPQELVGLVETMSRSNY